jgi:hypothetical protein
MPRSESLAGRSCCRSENSSISISLTDYSKEAAPIHDYCHHAQKSFLHRVAADYYYLPA